MNPELDCILGHSEVRSTLLRTLQDHGPAPAYLFLGEAGLGKARTALWLAARLNCRAPGPQGPCGACPSCLKTAHGSHPDLLVQERPPGKTAIGVGDVREGIAATHYRPYEGGYRVWIVAQAELLTEEAQNALLKTLEEPPGATVVILVSCSEPALLPTVTSRCRPVRFRPVPQEELAGFLQERGLEPERARVLARLAQGRPGKALELITNLGLWDLRAHTLEVLSGLPGAGLWPALEGAGRLAALRSGEEARPSLSAVLDTCQSWYRDMLHLAGGRPHTDVTNVDRLEALEAQAREGGLKRPRKALEKLLEAREHFQANVNTLLLLQRLCLHLRLL